MTDPRDEATRPISVAELLAKNGTIGAAPPGGRRRRRRGNSDSVTVAELTGEIPIVSAAGEQLVQEAPEYEPAVPEPAEPAVEESVPEPEPEPESVSEPEPEPEPEPEAVVDVVEQDAAPDTAGADTAEADTADTADTDTGTDTETEAEAEAETGTVDPDETAYEEHLQRRDAEPAPVDFAAPRRRPPVATPIGVSGAEAMSPDPVVDDEVDPDVALDFAALSAGVSERIDTSHVLFGGQGDADASDAVRRGLSPTPEDIDLGEAGDTGEAREAGAAEGAADTGEAGESRGSALLHGLLIVGQCVLAVAFGAGLFVAFDQLWKWNNIVALVLSVLVILGLVVGVRVVRKTEDIGSTLIAVAVGALVTLGPLALLQSH